MANDVSIGIRSGGRPEPTPDQRAEALRERIYVTFTVLAVTLALDRDVEQVTISGAAAALSLTVVGTLLAVFVADVVAQMVRDAAVPSRAQIAHLLWVCFESLLVIVVPMIVLGFGAFDLIDIALALRLIAIALAATLVVITLVAVWRLRASLGLKLVMLGIITALGAAVLIIELAIH